MRIEPCFSPVWDTAIVAICLRESGVPENHPAMKRAAEWLMEKEIRFAGDWVHKNPAKVEPSGWVFEYNNKWNPDVDDTAMVLLALRKIPTDNPQKRDECFQRGLKWMMTFQCKDGGWAAFDKDCTKNILEKVPVRRPQRHARPRMRRHHRAHSRTARLRRLEPEPSAGRGGAAITSASAAGRRTARGMAAGA